MTRVMGSQTTAEPLVFERSQTGRRASDLPQLDIEARPIDELLPGVETALDDPIPLPEVDERTLVKHYTRVSRRNHSIDLGFYPLGSCTMKYNPRVAERVAGLGGFAEMHPATPDEHVQGTLGALAEVEDWVCELTGMDSATLQPSAGAQGELVGLMIMRAYHEDRGDARETVIIPDSAHGTNPASVTLGGYETVTVPSGADGLVDVEALEDLVDEDVAGLMLTNPNTLGLFETEIERIADLLHEVGALLYYDGANFNAILGRVRPGDMGFDIVHLNVHKTFATPHGGGGPGGGPVGVSGRLADYLPGPVVATDDSGSFGWRQPSKSLGRVHGRHGNVAIMLRALVYLLGHGHDGLRRVAELSVLNANYLAARMAPTYRRPFTGDDTDVERGEEARRGDTDPGGDLSARREPPVMHEFVVTPPDDLPDGVRNMDLAKRLIDLGFHPPTVSFPLIVRNCFMIEPTETETPETLDAFAAAMKQVIQDSRENADLIHEAPGTTPVGRLDEATAARDLRARWTGAD